MNTPTVPDMKTIFSMIRTIAVVGLSDKPDRPSYDVASYLKSHGYTVIPVNPNITESLGEKSYPSLSAIPDDIHIDCVDLFRKSEDVLSPVQAAVERGDVSLIWMQEGVVNDEAATVARSHGLAVVMDRCMKKEHQKLSL